jgi:nucleoside-diphosphate-sugar epimerase
MARKPVVLVTGAGGELGHALISELDKRGACEVVALDMRPLAGDIARRCTAAVVGDVLDRRLLERLRAEYEISSVFHLAALLSTRAEFVPEMAHEVNVQGTLNVLQLAVEEARALGAPVKFFFPSSIAVYGLPDLATKQRAGAVREDLWQLPATMYGCTKLHGEHLGRYFARHYRQLTAAVSGVDFRAIRFPGLLSAFTLPSGGTTDYAPEMLHAAAQGIPCACFVREDTRLPFMTMPDAVTALLALMDAPREALTTLVYNVGAFDPSAAEFAALVRAAFPAAVITFAPDLRRQAIVDSWPENVDDTGARRDWGHRPTGDLPAAFAEYLLPNVKSRYGVR